MSWDQRGQGSREYTPEEYRRVVAHLRRNGQEVVRYEDLSRELGVLGRTLRAILSDADGVEFVLLTGDAGVACAGWLEEAERGTARMRSQARRMLERAERRERWAAAHLARQQGTLWTGAK